MAMLARVCAQQDQLAAAADTPLVADPFVFSLAIDGSKPMPPDLVTKRVAVLKEHLGIDQKSAAVIEREDEASHLCRLTAKSRWSLRARACSLRSAEATASEAQRSLLPKWAPISR